MRRGVVAALAVLLGVSISAGGAASGPVPAARSGRATSLPSVAHAIVAMVPLAPPKARSRFARASHPQRGETPEAETDKPSALLPSAIAARPARRLRGLGTPVISSQIEGLNSDQGLVDPPDVQVAAGPTAIVEMVNTVYAIWNRSGTLVAGGRLDDFYSRPGVNRHGDRAFDPHVLYDERSGRWFSALADLTRGEALIAVSDTSDPRGAWHLAARQFVDPISGTCPDQPRLGLSDAVVVLTVDLYADCNGNSLKGGFVIVFDKPELLTGSAVHVGTFDAQTIRLSQITPAVSLSPTAPDYLVSIERPSHDIVHLYTVTSAQQPISIRDVHIQRMDSPPDAPQRGTSAKISTGDDRVQNARWRNGKLLFVASDACRSGKVVAACARLAQVDTASSRLDWEKELTLGDGRHLFYPAAELDDAGNVLLTFGYSSGTEFPGIGAVTLQANGAFSSWTVVQRGSAPHLPLGSGPRYGDYFGIGRDPTVPNQVWAAAEYGDGLDDGFGWGTKIFAMSGGDASPPPPPPPDTESPSVKPAPTKAKRKKRARLRFAVRDNSGRAVVTMGVFRGSRRVKGFRPLELDNGRWFLNWRAPSRPSRLRFCVSAVDSAGNASKRACAPIRVT